MLKRITGRYYNIGFVQNSLEDVIAGKEIEIKYLDHFYAGHWFADPFILDVTDEEIWVLVEDFCIKIGRGRISLLKVDRKSLELKELIPVLTLDTHLSYPAIIRKEDNIYVYPENGDSGHLFMYKWSPDVMKLSKYSLLADGNLADATITSYFGTELLFATEYPHKDGKILDIYKRSHDGIFVKSDKIDFEENIARPAGDFFEYKGNVYRPAQESNHTYGHAVVLQEFSHHDGRWSVNEVRRIYSPSARLPLGIHTFNMYKGVIVVDSIGYKNPIAAKIIRFFIKFIKCLG